MKSEKYILVFVLTLAWSFSTKASDTLRSYKLSSSYKYIASSTNATYPLQTARIDIPKPMTLKSINVMVGGDTGQFTIRVFGHEGGVESPIFKKDLITPILVKKTVAGYQTLEIALPKSIKLTNNQFFVCFDNIIGKIGIAYDNYETLEKCNSTTGGVYRYTYLYNKNYEAWYYFGNNNLVIDLIVDYDMKDSPQYLRDVTESAGISLNHGSYAMSADDFNYDGYIDLLIGGVLYKNLKNNTFENITTQAGLSGSANAGCFIDMNNDGKMDILYLSSAPTLYINNGNETFTSKQLTGLPATPSLSSFSIADINNDGYPDLFVGQLWAAYPDSMPNYLLINNQNLDFVDSTELLANNITRRSRGSQWVDFDNDKDLDLYVANYYLEKDELWENNGNYSFSDISYLKNLDVNGFMGSGSNHGTGCDWYDYDNDGDFDLYQPQLAHPNFMVQYDHRGSTLYKNTGAPYYNFEDVQNSSIEYEETHAGGAWGDINNDGLADLVTTTFYGCRYIDLYLQKPDHTFEMKSWEYGLHEVVTGEDALWVDTENDGRLDLCVGNENKFRLYKNYENIWYNNFVSINLSSTTGYKTGVGSVVKVYSGGKSYMQQVSAGRGVKIQKPSRLYFGLAKAETIDSVVVFWNNPAKTKNKYTNLQVNKFYTLIEDGNVITSEKEYVNKNESFSVNTFPNPANEYVNFNISYSGKQNNINLEIYDVSGKLVYNNINAFQNQGRNFVWNLQSLSGQEVLDGLYIYRIIANDKIYTGKIIKK
ncbi:MAG: hypothetical protein A2X12_10395 [Bacteroidetes bacterium GWE2_29_8]|nr:MAG: hypothetical protein A2X12_10395 [Bacteroidetes bacterium GWE2_29_8]OFY16628.1 MAG: hypothetical protein A2X02_05675 [Bacteroidetes bacterium GWF2_29_10]